jgi:hypothetical protein
MPIHKKDRSFQNILREANIDEVPVEYIERLVLCLENGDRIIFEGEDLQDVEEPNIVLFVLSCVDQLGENHDSPVSDIEIIIDYNKLEKEIKSYTKKLLDKQQDDQSDSSV